MPVSVFVTALAAALGVAALSAMDATAILRGADALAALAALAVVAVLLAREAMASRPGPRGRVREAWAPARAPTRRSR